MERSLARRKKCLICFLGLSLLLIARPTLGQSTPEASIEARANSPVESGGAVVIATREHPAWQGDIRAYTVRSGDTAWRIAARHNTSVDQLMAMNEQVEDAERLFPGQHLLVPEPYASSRRDVDNAPSEPSCELLTVVASGELDLPPPNPTPPPPPEPEPEAETETESTPTPTPSPRENQNIRELIYADRVSDEVAGEIVALARRLEMDPNHLMTIMHYETGGSFRPSVRNPYTRAVGLIQFLPSTARLLGTTDNALERMTALEQLEWVERYLTPFCGRLATLEDAYMAVLYPAAVGEPEDFVLFRRGSRSYRHNPYLDRDEDGNVTKHEVGEAVRRVYEEGREALRAAGESE